MAVEDVLPLNMVREVLSWLPVVSVLRFRCVCKLWNSVTREDYFIYFHLERSKFKPPQIILHSEFRYRNREGHYIFEEPDGFTLLKETWRRRRLTLRPKLTLRSPILADYCGNSHPCNGLVCFYDDSAKFLLCNPATREVQILPDATPARKQICSLGFVARTKDYKVVRLLDLGDHHYEIQVLTVGNGSWRRVGDFSSCILLGEEGVHVDGTVHWMVRLYRDSKACTFSLDLTAEKLELVKLPDSVQGEGGAKLICLAPWKGKLALVQIKRPRWPTREPGIINVYKLQGHYENNNVWNRPPHCCRLTGDLFEYDEEIWHFFSCVSFVGDEHILTWRRGTSTVYFYCNSSWHKIYGPQRKVYGLYAFEESLVPLQKSAMLYEPRRFP